MRPLHHPHARQAVRYGGRHFTIILQLKTNYRKLQNENTPPASCWRGTFVEMVSEGHAGAEDKSAAKDEGNQGKQEHRGHEENELEHQNHPL